MRSDMDGEVPRRLGVSLVLVGIARAAFFVLLPAVAVGGALGIPVLLCLTGIASIRPSLLKQAFGSWPIILLLTLTAWIAVSSAWSPYAGALAQAAKIAILVMLGLSFSATAIHPQGRRLTAAGGVAAFFVLSVLLLIEAIWTIPINRAAQPDVFPGELMRNVMRGATVLLAITWATIALLLGRGFGWTILALAALIAGGLVSLQFGQDAHAVAFAAGLVGFAAAYAAPRIAILFVSAGLAFWTLAAPFLTPLILGQASLVRAMPVSWADRAEIWNYVAARIAERPWFGHGLDAGRAPAHELIPVHPHSASLHLWFDAGAVAAVLAAALLLVGGRELAHRLSSDRRAAAAACATLAALGVVANISYGLWAEWWIATMFVAAALVGSVQTTHAPR